MLGWLQQLAEVGRFMGNKALAADEHCIPHYGKKRSGTKGGKKKDATDWFERYTAIRAVSGKSPVMSSAYRIARGNRRRAIWGPP